MDTAVVQQFIDFFQDFVNLCQSENWPSNDTNQSEIKNAFIIAQHIEKCLDALQKQNVISEFLPTLNYNQNVSNSFFMNCFVDPPKFILKKIIISDSTITQMDIGFEIFLDLFNAEKLEEYLTDFMVEAASSNTLLQNINIELPKDKILSLKSQLFLAELSVCDNPSGMLTEILNKCTENTIELLVYSLTNNAIQHKKTQTHIVETLIKIMFAKSESHKSFWKYLFNVHEQYFIKMCTKHNLLYMYIVEALLDCGKLLKENLSMTYFYIDLTVKELTSVVQRITECDELKDQFIAKVRDSENVDFWENIMF